MRLLDAGVGGIWGAVFAVKPGETYDFAIRYRGKLYPQRIAASDPATTIGYRGASSGVDIVPRIQVTSTGEDGANGAGGSLMQTLMALLLSERAEGLIANPKDDQPAKDAA